MDLSIEFDSKSAIVMDIRGMRPPRLFTTLNKVNQTVKKGKIVEIIVNDPITMLYILAWIKHSNCELISKHKTRDNIKFKVQI